MKLARQLLADLENTGVSRRPDAKELPGKVGIFDGEQMVTSLGEKFEVPANYASKSLLVVGDTLKLVEENGQKRFKQIEHMKRHKTTGILTKKDGKFAVVTSEGSYKVLPSSVYHFKGQVGDEVILQIPAANISSPYGAIESIIKKKVVLEETKTTPELKTSQKGTDVVKETDVAKGTKQEPVIFEKGAKIEDEVKAPVKKESLQVKMTDEEKRAEKEPEKRAEKEDKISEGVVVPEVRKAEITGAVGEEELS